MIKSKTVKFGSDMLERIWIVDNPKIRILVSHDDFISNREDILKILENKAKNMAQVEYSMLGYLKNIKDIETKDENKKCGICMTNERIIVFLECGHMRTCASCTIGIIKAENPSCPFCKADIKKVLKVFD